MLKIDGSTCCWAGCMFEVFVDLAAILWLGVQHGRSDHGMSYSRQCLLAQNLLWLFCLLCLVGYHRLTAMSVPVPLKAPLKAPLAKVPSGTPRPTRNAGEASEAEQPLIKKTRLQVVQEKVAVSPPMCHQITLGLKSPCLTATEKASNVHKFTGIYQKLGLLNSKPLCKAQVGNSFGLCELCAYMWSDPSTHGYWWSRQPHDVTTGEPNWDEVEVIGFVDASMEMVWVPYNSHEASTVKVYDLQSFMLEEIKTLQDRVLLQEGEKNSLQEALQEALNPQHGIDPNTGLPKIIKTGWKNKICALITAYMMGEWNKATNLCNKFLGEY